MSKHFTICNSLSAFAALLLCAGGTWQAYAMEGTESHVSSPAADDALADGFATPPASARPRVWWHWMDGNVTEEGIRLDLEWMQRIGIGGVQNFDASLNTPQRVTSRLTYLSPAWQHAFRFAASTASQMGLELSVAGSPGWSESGGPWVKPADAMKKLVWSEMRVSGGKPFAGRLPMPPGTVGPFQNVPIDRGDPTGGGPPQAPVGEPYTDVAVVAFRTSPRERDLAQSPPAVSSSAGPIAEPSKLWDGDYQSSITLPVPASPQNAWVQYDFGQPQVIRALSLSLPSARPYALFVDSTHIVADLQASDDGSAFASVIKVHESSDVQQTLAFAPVTARYFRLLLLPRPLIVGPMAAFAGDANKPHDHKVAEFVLHGDARVNRAESKAAFFVAASLDDASTPAVPADSVIDPKSIIDLTQRLRSDGSLAWMPPAGQWTVVRFGYSLLGITNHPASAEGTGLEVDKLDAAHVRANYQEYLGRLGSFLSPDLMGAQGLHGMVNDSWEAGAQNWTEQMPEQFAKRCGYSLTAWLPALTGRVIGSAAATDAFLWDYRRALGQMLAENHYQTIQAVLHEHGMISYAESHESGRAFIGDGMATKRFADVPMSAMWANALPQENYDADIRESASVAHLYGQNLVAAESMTAAGNTFAFTPELLKPTADRELVDGLNRFVIHTSVHQPLNEPGPGFTLGPFGQWFTRHETWAAQAGPWINYLTRSAYLLQQGRFVADVLYFYGEDSNITALYGRSLPAIPAGFAFDFVNPEALHLLSVDNGDLITRSGMRYHVLILDPRTRQISVSVLMRLHKLVTAGATLIGAKPIGSPSFADKTADFQRLTDELWGAGGAGERRVGRGRVVVSASLQQAFEHLQLVPDVTFVAANSDINMPFVHRHLDGGEIYFLDNRQAHDVSVQASFHVVGKAPELWHADTGKSEPAAYSIVDGRTVVSLQLTANETVFVVFRQNTVESHLAISTERRTPVMAVSGPWDVRFQAAQQTPVQTTFTQLLAWNHDDNPDIKYFSGTAEYRHTLSVDPAWLARGRLELDLGSVQNLAEVVINDRSLGVLWKQPFRVDITNAVRAGDNQLLIKVTNTWVNRLIGDKQPGAAPHAYATYDPYEAGSPLLDSGLLGPVQLLGIERGP